jgi:hypothetical protein
MLMLNGVLAVLVIGARLLELHMKVRVWLDRKDAPRFRGNAFWV